MKVKIVVLKGCVICSLALVAGVLTGCTGVPAKADVNMAPKPMPNVNDIQPKPGQTKVRAIKNAFNAARPGI